jgi:hypothetical protein
MESCSTELGAKVKVQITDLLCSKMEIASQMMRKIFYMAKHSLIFEKQVFFLRRIFLETVFTCFSFDLVDGSTTKVSRALLYKDHQNVKKPLFNRGDFAIINLGTQIHELKCMKMCLNINCVSYPVLYLQV